MAERLLIRFRRGARDAIERFATSDHARRSVRQTIKALRAAWPSLPRTGDGTYLVAPVLRCHAAPVLGTGYVLLYTSSEWGVTIWGMDFPQR